ncbi:hypothetical protein GGR53DRAFT_509354 [Hypoxylon sp. FL1150]|nr:hypothetical protein GGR53DRAFT_509354 [Hypoxylon sp. FL1150]
MFDKVISTDKQTLELGRNDNNMAVSKLAAWTERKDVEVALRCLCRVLQKILEIANNQACQGRTKFAVQQLRKREDSMEVKLDAENLTIDLVSPTMVEEIGREEDW